MLEFLADNDIDMRVLRFGLPDRFIGQGTQTELREECGLLPAQIAEKIKRFISK